MKNVFPIIENPYDLRNETKFKSRNVNTVRYGGAAFQEVTKNFYLFYFLFLFLPNTDISKYLIPSLGDLRKV